MSSEEVVFSNSSSEESDLNLPPGIILTENGDKAFDSTDSLCLDYFVRITRTATINDYIESFLKALKEDFETAVKLLLNMRDVRGGKGEKKIPIVTMAYLKTFKVIPTETYESILKLFIKYGCWKDIVRISEIAIRSYSKIDVDFEMKLFADQITLDAEAYIAYEHELKINPDAKKPAISLCAKWTPSEKSHFDTKPLCFAKRIRKHLGLNPKSYRQTLSILRSHLNILERFMSRGEYDKIDFSTVPSVAMLKMKKAFNRETNSKGQESDTRKELKTSYANFLAKLADKTSDVKVNTKCIHPHEIIANYVDDKICYSGKPPIKIPSDHSLEVLYEAQWNSIIEETKKKAIFDRTLSIVDTSGSMSGQPLLVAVALGLLVAECTIKHNNSPAKIITFSENPRWVEITGSNLRERVHSMIYADWGGSTDMRKTFELILNDAVQNNLSQEQMPDKLIIFTDMQFNSACGYREKFETTFEIAEREFREKGYSLPHIVCWNLRTSDSKTLPVKADTKGYTMISGFSNEMMKFIMNGDDFTPYTLLLHALESYEVIPKPETLSIGLISESYDPTPFNQFLNAVDKSEIKKSFIKPKDEN